MNSTKSMIKLKPFERLEKKYSFREKDIFSNGSSGKIYLDKGDVVKIPYDFGTGVLLNSLAAQKRIFNGAQMQEFAFEMGLKFPEVYGLFAVKEEESGKYYPGFAMKCIKGITLGDLEGAVREKAEMQKKNELNKARNLGFIVGDINPGNAIWCPEEEQTYLLDCEFWGYRTEIN